MAKLAPHTNAYGSARVTGGTLSGPMLGKSFSTIELIGATQVLNPLQNFVTESSKLIADRLASAPGAAILQTDFICLPPAAARISW